jgi:Na+(H+)/acetate symporter ActP
MNLTLGIFIIILLITLGITYWAARRTHTTSDFYAADSQLTASQNGFALAGDWCSAAAFLGLPDSLRFTAWMVPSMRLARWLPFARCCF